MLNRIELELCDDCMVLEETGDATSFDHHYSEPEATTRLTRCEAGWRSIRAQGNAFNDASDEPQLICSECGHIHTKADVKTVYSDEWDEHQFVCPSCSAVDSMSDRTSGRDEFSWSECDCCGSTLGGSRTRYALFPREPAEGGPVVYPEVAQPAG